jgi:hypothetical protein
MFKTLNQTLKTLKILTKTQIKQSIKPDEKIILWAKKYFVTNPNPSSSLAYLNFNPKPILPIPFSLYKLWC